VTNHATTAPDETRQSQSGRRRYRMQAKAIAVGSTPTAHDGGGSGDLRERAGGVDPTRRPLR